MKPCTNKTCSCHCGSKAVPHPLPPPCKTSSDSPWGLFPDALVLPTCLNFIPGMHCAPPFRDVFFGTQPHGDLFVEGSVLEHMACFPRQGAFPGQEQSNISLCPQGQPSLLKRRMDTFQGLRVVAKTRIYIFAAIQGNKDTFRTMLGYR